MLYLLCIFAEHFRMTPFMEMQISDKPQIDIPYRFFIEVENELQVELILSVDGETVGTYEQNKFDMTIYPKTDNLSFHLTNKEDDDVVVHIRTPSTHNISNIKSGEYGVDMAVELEYNLRRNMVQRKEELKTLNNFKNGLNRLYFFLRLLMAFQFIACVLLIFLLHKDLMALFSDK